MKHREEITRELFANRFENKSASALGNIIESFEEMTDAEFAFIVFKTIIQNEIYICPSSKISNQDMASYYDAVVEKARKKFAVIDPIFERQENHIFLQRIKDGTVEIYNALNDSGNATGSCLLESALRAYLLLNHMYTREIGAAISFIQSEDWHLTLPYFMKSHGAHVITKISKDLKEDILYSYLYVAHWYLLKVEDGMYNVIDFSGQSKILKKPFMDGHKEIAAQIIYTDKFNTQLAIEKAIGGAGHCGKISIVIHNHYTASCQTKADSPIEEYFTKLECSLKENYEFYKEFITEILFLRVLNSTYIRDDYLVIDGTRESSYTTFKEFKNNVSDDLSCLSNAEHNKFISTLEHSNTGFLSDNWNLIKYITFGLTVLVGLYMVYDSYFNNNGTVDTDSVEHLIGDILSHEEI